MPIKRALITRSEKRKRQRCLGRGAVHAREGETADRGEKATTHERESGERRETHTDRQVGREERIPTKEKNEWNSKD